MDQQQVHALIKEFGDLIGIPDLAFDETGSCTFEIVETDLAISIVFEDGDDQLTLMVALPEIELDDGVLLSLLEANFLGGVAGGAAFAVDPMTENVFLIQSVDSSTGAQILANAMQVMIDTASTWDAELRDSSEELDGVDDEVERPARHGFEPGIRV